MANKLAMVAVSGLVLGIVLLGTAALVGGNELRNGGWEKLNLDNWDGKACNITLAGKRGSRSLDWNAGDRVDINLPANVHYKRGQGEKVVIEGDEALLSRVRIDDNDIEMDCRLRNRVGDRLTVTLPGREFRSYAVHGSSTVMLDDLDQADLEISIAGSGDITASGRVERVDFDVAGSGKGRFGNLDAGTVSISIAGSGDAEVAPREKLSVDIAGSGKVTLKTEPQSIDTSIAGSGRIIHVDGSVSRSSGLSHRSGGNDRRGDEKRDDEKRDAEKRDDKI